MTTIEALKQKVWGLSGSISPGDARALARLVSDVCEHLANLNNEVSELRSQIQDVRREIAELQEEVKKQN